MVNDFALRRDVTQNMNNLMSEISRKIDCDSECQERRSVKEKKKDWENARSVFNEGPGYVQAKERVYLEAKYGTSRAAEILTAKYRDEASETIRQQLRIISDMGDANESSIAQLALSSKDMQSLGDLVEIRKEEERNLSTATRTRLSDRATNDQKAIFGEQALDSLKFYSNIVFFIYMVLFALYLFFITRRDEGRWRRFGVPIALLVVLLFSRRLSYLVFD